MEIIDRTQRSTSYSQLCKEFLREYSNALFSQRLRENGFVDYNGEGLCWYRVMNHDMIQSIYFYIDSQPKPYLIPSPDIGYGAHGLFLSGPLPLPAHYRRYDFHEYDCEIFESITFRGEKKDVKTFDNQIAPVLQRCQTAWDCYLYHRENVVKRVTRIQAYSSVDPVVLYNWKVREEMSPSFIDEILYFEDQDMYPMAIAELECRLSLYSERLSHCKVKKMAQWYINQLHQAELQQSVLIGNGRQAWQASIEARKQKFIKQLQKKLNIQL